MERGVGDERMEIVAEQRMAVALPDKIGGAQMNSTGFGPTEHRLEIILQLSVQIPTGIV